MPQDQRTRQGYLLLADISGYTAFLTGTELEHAHAIIHELTTLIRERLAPPMRFVKLEGDAVFCYADAASFQDGERLVELVEACYFDFSNRLLDMTRSTTCRCDACAAIGSLDLKFVTHYGSFVVERDGDREDLAGPDVILVHRLLKNTISDGGGPQAYAFLTDACLQRMPQSFDLPSHSESYESFGQTTGGVHDLAPVVAQMREARRVYIGSEDADLEISFGEIPYPPAVLWQYFVDPEKRLALAAAADRDREPAEPARTARGRGVEPLRPRGRRRRAARVPRLAPVQLLHQPLHAPGSRAALLPRHRDVRVHPDRNRHTRVDYRFRLEDCGPLTRLRFRIFRPGRAQGAEPVTETAQEDPRRGRRRRAVASPRASASRGGCRINVEAGRRRSGPTVRLAPAQPAKGGVLKLVIGIVRPEKANDVLEALYRAEVRGVSLSRVQGHGGELDRVETYRGTTVQMGLADKVRFEIAVSDPFVEPTIEALCAGARTGEVGDGKIFVVPLERAVRIRTGETDHGAVTPVGG